MRTWTPTWETFDHFPRRPSWSPSWSSVIEWLDLVRETVHDEVEAIRPLLNVWDASLKPMGGDPAREDWERFRPLRLSREEDWSDWLAFLLGAPEGWAIAQRLFPPAQAATKIEAVLREEPVLSGDRRADLVLLWTDNRASDLEVKLWDQNFDKTVETAKACRDRFDTRCDWADYVLLPDESEEAWSASDGQGKITPVTWTELCRELRRELHHARGSYQWLAFARAFCGAVEQRILGIPCMPREHTDMVESAAVFRFGRILREAV